jgi:mannose-6-phosphate isomerase-like protein (cupin superfamily)
VLEVDPGCMVPRHTDSAEELIVVVSGSATVTVGDETATAPSGATALVPACVPHEVRNTGEQILRFWAVYASPEVTTTYEEPVQPDGGRERSPVG